MSIFNSTEYTPKDDDSIVLGKTLTVLHQIKDSLAGGGGDQGSILSRLDSIIENQSLMLGQKGGEIIVDGNASGDFIALKAISDITINSISLSSNWEGESALEGKDIFAGDSLVIGFTEIDIDGTAQLFYK